MGRDGTHLFGWVVAAFIAAMFLFFLFKTGFENALCSGPDDPHCLRDWFAAASGWFGGAATFATVLYLARQVQTAEEEKAAERASAAFERSQLAKRVKRAVNHSTQSHKYVMRGLTMMSPALGGQDLVSLRELLRMLRSHLEDPAFAELEARYALDRSYRTAVSGVDTHLQRIDEMLKHRPAAPPGLIRVYDVDVRPIVRGIEKMSYVPDYLEEASQMADQLLTLSRNNVDG